MLSCNNKEPQRAYEFRRGEMPVANLRLITVRAAFGDEQWRLDMEGSCYELAVDISDFYLRLDNEVVASASKRLFRHAFDIVWGPKQYKLKSKGWAFWKKFQLLEGDRKIGSISWHTSKKVNDAIDIPDEISTDVQVFMTWLVMYTQLAPDRIPDAF